MRHIGKPPVCAICQVILLQISGDTIACSTVCLNWPASVVLTLALSRLEKVWSTAHDHTWPPSESCKHAAKDGDPSSVSKSSMTQFEYPVWGTVWIHGYYVGALHRSLAFLVP